MISLSTLVHVVLGLVILGLIVGLLHFLITYLEGKGWLKDPYAGLARVVLVIFGVLCCIALLLSIYYGQAIIVP